MDNKETGNRETRNKETEKKDKAGRSPRWGRRRAALVCGIVALVAAAATAWQLADFYGREARSEQKMKEIREAVMQEELGSEGQEAGGATTPESGTEEPGGVEEAAGKDLEGPIERDPSGEDLQEENPYRELFGQNEDMAAWLSVEGTKIEYPVMQTMEDENYYLKRDFYGNADEAGCLILDTDSDLQGTGTTNLIIHGHNMKAGTMFGELDLYEDEDYCSEHRHMELYLEGEKRQYEVIAVFHSQVYYADEQVFKYYDFFQADSEKEFSYFYDNIKNLSLYDTGVTAQPGDSFLTLSTCAYHVEDGRFVVVAKETGRQRLGLKEEG